MGRAIVMTVLLLEAFALEAREIVVTAGNDSINGDVSSVAALMSRPGADGISIREAIAAASRDGGPHAIHFAPALDGSTVPLTQPLLIRTGGIEVRGNATADGRPAITLDGSGITTPLCCRALVFVLASHSRVSRLRFTGVSGHGIEVRAGLWFLGPSGSTHVHDVLIDENEFDGSSGGGLPAAVRIWNSSDSADCTIERVTVIRNVIRNYSDVGVIANASGARAVLRDIVVSGNRFSGTVFPIEVAFAFTSVDSRIERTRIERNEIAGGTVPLLVGAIATSSRMTGNVLDDTVIARNRFVGELDTIDVSTFAAEATASAGGNRVSGFTIENNLIDGGRGVTIVAGGSGATDNRVERLRIINNTITTRPLPPITILADRDGGSRNSITDVLVRNTIAVRPAGGPGADVSGDLRAADVFTTITTDGTFAGINGNFAGDPRLEAGSRQLAAGSPAIDRGSSEDAPATDLECRSRVGAHDIGAFESGATPVARLTLVAHGPGRVTHSPAGTVCGGTTAYARGTAVTLSAQPSDGASFAGWSGDGDCIDGSVVANGDVYCVATFHPPIARRRATR